MDKEKLDKVTHKTFTVGYVLINLVIFLLLWVFSMDMC